MEKCEAKTETLKSYNVLDMEQKNGVNSLLPLSTPALVFMACFVMYLICQLIDTDSSNIFEHFLFHTRALQIYPFQGIAIYLNN